MAQQITLSGSVKDSTGVMPNTNILATPYDANTTITFAITDAQGNYNLQLQQNSTYKIAISYLGYVPQEIDITTTTKNSTKNFVLQPATNTLDEVVLNYKIPLVIKEDTLVYDADSFTNGKERKLRDILKKLPGAEVDRDGNVTVKGKKVTKVMVEGKTFFTGDSKLAVNNIPADAVDKIEVLDNYSEVAFLKGLEDSDKMAMNIKLKEGKKKFVFGDIEAGKGNKEYYMVHPTLFYYSPKTNVNFIADINNIGIKSFTMKDYLNFNGGIGNLMSNMGAYVGLYNDEFARYLSNTDFKSNTNRFGAFNLRQSINKHLDINTYVIGSNNDTETIQEQLRSYISNTETEEKRTTTNATASKFLLSKLNIAYKPSHEEDLSLNTSVKLSSSNNYGYIVSTNEEQNITLNNLSSLTDYDINQNLSYSKILSKNHTGTIEASIQTAKQDPEFEWNTNQELLQGILPLQDADWYRIFQQKEIKNTRFNAIAKEYWVLNNFNHLYTSVGTSLSFDSFYSNEYQLSDTAEEINFYEGGFGNQVKYALTDVFAGLEYKFQLGKFTVKPGVFYHGYQWSINQKDSRNTNFKGLLLPQVSAKLEFNNSENIFFSYKKNARFPSVTDWASRYLLQNFNSVYQGNQELSNTLYHTISLNYYKFNLYRGLFLTANTTYNKRINSIKNRTIIDGINLYTTPMLLNLAEHNVLTSLRVRKKINKLRYNLKTTFNYSDFYQVVNNQTSKNNSKNIQLSPSITSFFNEKWPELELGYSHSFSFYNTSVNNSKFTSSELYASLEYRFLKDFLAKADYTHSYYQNKQQGINNMFDIANASVLYQKENSPWGIELSGNNIFNTTFRQENSFSDYLITDTQTFVMPRVLLIKVFYKL